MRDARASASVASASEARARAKNREKSRKNREKSRKIAKKPKKNEGVPEKPVPKVILENAQKSARPPAWKLYVFKRFLRLFFWKMSY